MANQTRNGSAFEYAMANTFKNAVFMWLSNSGKNVGRFGNSVIIEDSRYDIVKSAYQHVDSSLAGFITRAAVAGWRKILYLEPMLVYGTAIDPIIIQVSGNAGSKGDVRDIILVRQNISGWELGISCKWNHNALKHSRLSDNIDFGDAWAGFPCSDDYWNDISVPFGYLERYKGLKWCDVDDKFTKVYRPVMDAFSAELKRLDSNQSFALKMVEYIVGREAFYKVIGRDSTAVTDIQVFNLNDTLNKSDKNGKPQHKVSKVGMPTRIIDTSWINNTTIEVVLDHGWAFTMRVHNADSVVQNLSVKLDIQFSGSPFPIYTEAW